VSAQLPGGCTVTREGTTVTLSFGPSPGCTVGGLTLTGTVIVSLTKQGSVTTTSLTFTDMTVDGVALSGSAVFTTTDGSTFDVALSLTKDARSVSAQLRVVGAAGAFTVDGSASVSIERSGLVRRAAGIGLKTDALIAAQRDVRNDAHGGAAYTRILCRK
jgi:hypothetical protein